MRLAAAIAFGDPRAISVRDVISRQATREVLVLFCMMPHGLTVFAINDTTRPCLVGGAWPALIETRAVVDLAVTSAT